MVVALPELVLLVRKTGLFGVTEDLLVEVCSWAWWEESVGREEVFVYTCIAGAAVMSAEASGRIRGHSRPGVEALKRPRPAPDSDILW
jgi:hypothetical protein